MSTIGMARSTQISRYLKPSEYGRSPTISICTWSNLSVGSENLLYTGLLWRDILAVRQPLQERHHLVMSIFIPYQTKLVLISGFVALCERWSKPCKFVKTFFRNFAVIYGFVCPVDTSHQIELLSNDLSNLKFNLEDVEWSNRVNSVSKAWSSLYSLYLIAEALPIADTDGREKASATKFVSPFTYLISVVNSAI